MNNHRTIQRAHRWANVGRRNNVGAAPDGGRDDGWVVGVGDDGDDVVVYGRLEIWVCLV